MSWPQRLSEQVVLLALSLLVGLLAGLSSAAFLLTLEWATATRLSHPALLFGLPVAGLAIGLVYHYGGGRAAEGNNLIIDEIHDPQAWVPRRMAPMIFVGTVMTQLFGGSAGREGAAIQMSGSLTDWASRTLRISPAHRRILLVAAISAGFGAVFGLEVQRKTGKHLKAVVPCLVASVTGSVIVTWLGITHTLTPDLGHIELSFIVLLKVTIAAVAFGLIGTVFSVTVHLIKLIFARLLSWFPAWPFFGGLVVIALSLLWHTRIYNGLSIGLIEQSLFGGPVPTWAFAAKLLLTAVTLGSGFVGGEVTPLFVMGATLGASLALLLHLPVPFLAALGFVAVFGGAANAPIACTIMGLELFGVGAAPYFLLACFVSFAWSSHRGLYSAGESSSRSLYLPWCVQVLRRQSAVANIP